MKKRLLPLVVLLPFLCGCNQKEDPKTIKIAATAIPHAEILQQVKPLLEEKGLNLQVIVVDDYNIANRILAEGEVDANFFQHAPFLEEECAAFSYKLQSLVAVHSEPMGIYAEHLASLDAIKEGSVVAIPSDPVNEARALLLLHEAGLIRVENKGSKTALWHIVANPHKLQIKEIDAALLPRLLGDVAIAVIPMNFALAANKHPQEDALFLESEDTPFANIVAVRENSSKKVQLDALKTALQDKKVQAFIHNSYHGAIIPIPSK